MQSNPNRFLLWLINVMIALGVLSLSAAHGAAPSNDQCSGAIVIPSSGFPRAMTPIDISGATSLNDPPLPVFPGFERTNVANSVWFKFTPAVAGLYTFSTGPDTYTTFRDSAMAVYTATGDCGPFSLYTFNDDSGSLRASVSTNFAAGTTYYVVVFTGLLTVQNPENSLELQLRVSKPEVPSNDTCATPFVFPSNISSSVLSDLFDTTLATTTALLTNRCVTNAGALPSRDLWFQFTPATSGTYIFSTGADTATSALIDGTLIDDTSIGIFTLNGGCGSFNEITCNDNGFGRSVLSTTLTAGTSYYIAVWDNAPSYVPGETALRLRISPATRPTVSTLTPLSLSSTGAVLSGTVNGNGVQSRFWFEWGATESLGSTSAVRVLFPSALTYETNLVVTGFQRDMLYYYRIVATNSLGRSTGGLQTFMWFSTPPALPRFEKDIDGTYPIEFEGEPGHVYIVQSSSNLVHWADVAVASTNYANPPTPTGYGLRYSPGPVPPPMLFFRIKMP